jgi:Ca2+-binding RTX toxin-like protein
MTGGDGNDVYVVDETAETITEAAGAGTGTDTVQSSATFTLLDNVENLTLTGTAANGTGNAAANTLIGNARANTLDGAAGIDTMAGGTGDDTYIVDGTGESVSEGFDAGQDTVQSSATFDLGANIERLVLTGVEAINGTGNGLANIMTGNGGVNVLSGGEGNDVIDGGGGDDTLIGGAGDEGITGGDGADSIDPGAGNDIMAGGAGADTFLFALGFGEDTISGWEAGDKISLNPDLGAANFAALDDATNGALDDADALVAVTGGNIVIDFGEDVLTIEDVTVLHAGDFTLVA